MAKRATAAEREKFQRIADEQVRRAGVVYLPWRGTKGQDGEAWISTDGEKIVQAPRPTSLENLFIILHEVGHHRKGHVGGHGNGTFEEEGREEWEASKFAIDVLRSNGLDTREIEEEELERIDQYYSSKEAHERALKLQRGSSRMKPKKKNPVKLDKFNFSKSNPSKKNLFGLGSKKTTYSTRLMREAYAAGLKSGDTDDLKPWIQKHDSKSLSRDAVEKLKDAYMAGVLSVGRVPREKGAKAVYEREIFRQLANPKKKAAKKPKKSKVTKKASARARRKPATVKRATKKAPTQKAAKKNPTIWNGHQGNVKAEVTKPLIGGKYTAKISRGSVVIESKPFATAQGAISFARLRMHDRASNPAADLVPGGGTFMKTVDKTGAAWQKLAKRIKSQLATRKKSNPVDTAVKAYEEFHGLPTHGVIEVEEMEHRHEWTWLVGLLACIDVKLPNGQEVPLVSPGFSFSDPSRIERKKRRAGDSWIFNDRIAPDKVVLLTAVENGKQLLLKGGDQSLPLKELGFSERDERDHMVIGEIQEITYRTKKKFEDKGKTDTDFYHEFGKEGSGGVKPQLIYHPLSKHMQIVGGRYEVARPEKSLGNVSPGIIG